MYVCVGGVQVCVCACMCACVHVCVMCVYTLVPLRLALDSALHRRTQDTPPMRWKLEQTCTSERVCVLNEERGPPAHVHMSTLQQLWLYYLASTDSVWLNGSQIGGLHILQYSVVLMLLMYMCGCIKNY